MEKLIYTKYSNERSARFAIRTDIYEDGQGRRCVRKYADTETARPHIEHIQTVYEQMQTQFRGSRFVPNKAELHPEYIEFEYVEGETLEKQLDAYLAADDQEGFAALVNTYADEVRRVYGVSGTTEIAIADTEAAREVGTTDASIAHENAEADIATGTAHEDTSAYAETFGTVTLPTPVPMAQGVDIDLIFANIIVTGDTWTAIDYEWTFDFAAPVDFLLWRAGKVYLENYANRACISEEQMNALLGVAQANVDAYRQMELYFLQQYCYRGRSDLYELYGTMGQYVAKVKPEDILRGDEDGTTQIQIFYDTGHGFSEEESDKLHIYPDEKGEFHLQHKLPANLQKLRIDPGERACVIQIWKAKAYTNGSSYKMACKTNGYALDESRYVIPQDDPQIYIKNIQADTLAFELDYTVQTDAAGIQSEARRIGVWQKIAKKLRS